MDLAHMRSEYRLQSLDQSDVTTSPFAQFTKWFEEAKASQVPEGNAMTLATCDSSGRPSARVVLLKALDARGFTFFTNYESRKGSEISSNPAAALLFFWPQLERQVRIEGVIERVSAEESDTYFATRPAGSRVGAWASPQSRPLASREQLEKLFADAQATHGDTPPRPPHWGGYRLLPLAFEFWQGRTSRLHDRICYEREAIDAADWRILRRAP